MQKLLIVVDTQYDFMMKAGKLPIPGAEEMIGPMITYLATLDPGEYPYILFTFDTHDEAEYLESEEGKQFPMHCDRHSNGWKNVLPIEMTPDESNLFSLEKKVFSMFEESNVITHELGDALPGTSMGVIRTNSSNI
jgi:nicotinamidase/pyrazinamidase